MTRPCATDGCSRQTPPTPRGQAKPYRYCTVCRAERIKETARRGKRRQRGQEGSGVARPRPLRPEPQKVEVGSWWVSKSREELSAEAASRAETMSNSALGRQVQPRLLS